MAIPALIFMTQFVSLYLISTLIFLSPTLNSNEFYPATEAFVERTNEQTDCTCILSMQTVKVKVHVRGY